MDIKHRGRDDSEYRVIAAASALQLDRRDIKVMVISDSPNELAYEIKKYISRQKVEYVSLHAFQYQTPAIYKKFNLIIAEFPAPNTLKDCIYYSKSFLEKIYFCLEPDGVLAAALPHCDGVYYQTAAVLRSIFPSVKPGPGKENLLLCGGNNITGLPTALDHRTKRIDNTSFPLPHGLFSIISTPEEYASKYSIFPFMLQEADQSGFNIYDLFKSSIKKQKNTRVFYNILEYAGGYSIILSIILCIVFLVIRYFYSAGEAKNYFIAMENGFFAGVILFLMLTHFSMYSPFCFVFIFLCGIFLAVCTHKIMGIWQIRIGGLLGILALISAGYLQNDIWSPVIALAGGFSFGTEAISLSKSGLLQYPGISAGIMSSLFLFYNKSGMVFLIIYGILTKISAICREDDKKI